MRHSLMFFQRSWVVERTSCSPSAPFASLGKRSLSCGEPHGEPLGKRNVLLRSPGKTRGLAYSEYSVDTVNMCRDIQWIQNEYGTAYSEYSTEYSEYSTAYSEYSTAYSIAYSKYSTAYSEYILCRVIPSKS